MKTTKEANAQSYKSLPFDEFIALHGEAGHAETAAVIPRKLRR